MIRFGLLTLCAAFLLSIATVDAARADESWIDLFDGKSLNGWHKNPQRIGHGTGGNWTVEDGVITGEQDPPGSGNGGILLTDRKFADFEVVLELKPDWGVDSGFFLRGNDRGQCFQVMVDYHEAGNVGHIYGEGTGGFNNRPYEIFGKYDEQKKLTSLFTKPNDAKLPAAKSISGEDWEKAWKLGEWNKLRVKVVGNPPTINTWINDQHISEFNGATYNGPGYNKSEVAKVLGSEGSIAVQVHGGAGAWPKGAKCRWKNIKIRELQKDDANQSDAK